MTEAERLTEEKKASATLEAMGSKRDLSRTYCVVDMDMFYAAVEIRDRPELAHKPVAIGGLGMISTANYVARLYGVRSAMPGFIAAEMVRNPQAVGSKMPPDELVFIAPDFSKYTQVAMETREIFREYDPHFHSISLDEAYLDLSAYLAARGGVESADAVVAELRRRIKETTCGLTCSAGIGPNLMLAKICSDDNKPDGQSRIQPTCEAVLDYVQDLPIRRIPGVGKVLERQLKVMFDIVTCGQLRASASAVLRVFESRPKTSSFLLRVSLGLSSDEVEDGDGAVVGVVDRKSLSSERTFAAQADAHELHRRLLELCHGVAKEMATHTPVLAAKCVALKLKTSSFEVRNKEKRLTHFIGFESDFGAACSLQSKDPSRKAAVSHHADDAPQVEDSVFDAEVSRVGGELHAVLSPLLDEQLPCELRLMGVRVSGFRGAQSTLERGQQQLGRFFMGGHDATTSSSAKSLDSAAATKDAGQERQVEESHEYQQEVIRSNVKRSAEVLEVDDDDDYEDVHLLDNDPSCIAVQSSADAHTSACAHKSDVRCPVCGAWVPTLEADEHVNNHYDAKPRPSSARAFSRSTNTLHELWGKALRPNASGKQTSNDVRRSRGNLIR